MSILKIHTTDKLEYQLDGYFQNNTILFNNDTMPFYYDIIASSGTVYLEEVNKEKLELKEIETNIVDEFVLVVTTDQVYLEEQTALDGLYRYAISIDGVMFYSDLFCVKEHVLTEINTMKGGMLKVYDTDFIEFNLDGYLSNNTMISNSGGVVPFYFDTELTISTFSCELMQLDKDKIKVKHFSEVAIKSVTLLDSGNKLYLLELSQEVGIYRYKITVNSEVFYSGLFEVCEVDTILGGTFDSTLVFFDSTLITFDYE